MLDSSTNVGQTKWNSITDLARSVLDNIGNIDRNGVRVSVLIFGGRSRVVVPFEEFDYKDPGKVFR